MRHFLLRSTIGIVVCLPALLAIAAPAQSQPAPAAAAQSAAIYSKDADGKISVRATRITRALRIDGRLDDEVYGEVQPITDLIQSQPKPGAPGTDRTEAWVLFDDNNIYISLRCWQDPSRIVGNDMRRDNGNMSRNDHIAVGFDTFYDGRNGYQFNMSAAGGIRDGLVTNERFDANWNGVWDGNSSRFEGGWTGEMAIPFKTLRYAPGRDQVWHLQIRRLIAGKNEMLYLTPMPPQLGIQAMNRYSFAATMTGLEAPPAGINLELKPYGISGVTTDNLGTRTPDNDLDKELDGDAGFDGKYALTQGLVADFTYRTDFAQVEADENQVNLTRFSIQFPEKRDFFLENQGLFNFGSGGGGDVGGGNVPSIFYTRRIGLAGQRAVPVIGGGRVAGKAGLWSLGALNMTTEREETSKVAQTNFTVLRLRRDILGRSNIGAILTHRDISATAPGADCTPAETDPGHCLGNTVYGFDANFAFGQNTYFSGYVSQSRTGAWKNDDVLSRDDLSYRAQFNYNADRYGLAVDRLIVQPNINPEVGFLRRTNFPRSYLQARFSPRTTNNERVRRWVYQATLDYYYNNETPAAEKHMESRSISADFTTEFHSSDSIQVSYDRNYELLVSPFRVASLVKSDDGKRRDIRIPVGGYSFDNVSLSYTVGAQHRISGTPSIGYGEFYGGHKTALAYRGRVEVGNQLGIEPNVSFNWVDLPNEYCAAQQSDCTFRDTLLSTRVSFTMTPRMFVAALVQYSSSNWATSTNLRFRWEYQPGSELFVVYSEGRSVLEEDLQPLNRFGDHTPLQNRGLVVKVNRLFRF
jgi:hypothetical protein